MKYFTKSVIFFTNSIFTFFMKVADKTFKGTLKVSYSIHLTVMHSNLFLSLVLSNFFFQKFFSDRRKIENFFIEEKFEIFFLSVIVKSEPFFFPAQKIPTSFSFPVYARTFCHDSSFSCDRIKESLNYCVYRIGTKKLSVSQRS